MKSLFFIGLFLLLGIGASIIDRNFATLVIILGWGFMGWAFIYLFYRKWDLKQYRADAILLFAGFFFLYTIYTLITNYQFVENPYTDYYVARDSLHYFYAVDLKIKNLSLPEALKAIQIDKNFQDCRGFEYVCYFIGIAADFLGSNTLFIQKLQVVFCAALITVIVYFLLLRYVIKSAALKGAILFGLFSWTAFYSAMLLRDVQIAFFFGIAFEALFRKKAVPSLIVLFITAIVTYTYRPENGYFYSLFIGAYLILRYKEYFTFKKIKLKYVSLILFILIPIACIIFINGKNMWDNTINVYTEYGLARSPVHSMNRIRYGLPFPLRWVANICISQIAPFPITNTYKLFGKITGWQIIPMIAEICWFFLFSFVIINISKFRNTHHKYINELFYILLISATLICMASIVSPLTRRIMCVYPGIYISGVYLFTLTNHIQKIKKILILALVYLFLLLLYYFILKYIIAA